MQKSIYSVENVILCEMLRSARQQRKLTQTQLAERLGKPQSFIAKVERGERRLDVVEFVKVIESIELSAPHFLQQYMDELEKRK
nr:helix-turn-helix transcriptional regulator [Cerasicoccus frondis]